MWPRCPNAVCPCIDFSATMFYRNPEQIRVTLRKRGLCRLLSQGKKGSKLMINDSIYYAESKKTDECATLELRLWSFAYGPEPPR